jgi:CRP-like cAMP-binding protein
MNVSPGRLDRLRAVPLFAELTRASLSRLAGAVTEFEAPAGYVLIHPGMEGTGMFVLEEGKVVVEVKGRTHECGEGEFFGELALLDPRAVRTARVRALTPIRCLAISRQDFADLLDHEPSIAVEMLPILARRLADSES